MTRLAPTNAGHTKWNPKEELSVQQQGDTNNSYGTIYIVSIDWSRATAVRRTITTWSLDLFTVLSLHAVAYVEYETLNI
jgi:hypothetical protein